MNIANVAPRKKISALNIMANIHDAKILIIDDEPNNVDLLKRMLEEENFSNIYTAIDPMEGLEIYMSEGIDLVLLDMLMPGMSGLQVLEEMQLVATELPLPVIVLTAQADPETLANSFEAGAADFIGKPLNDVEVFARIESILLSQFYKHVIENQNHILEEKVEERTKELTTANKELKHSQREILKRLGVAAEYRDNETGLHVTRMSNYCSILGEELGLDNSLCEMLLLSAPLHDLGKIAVPDEILLKPAKLTKEEWEIMKTHPEKGGKILSNSGVPLIEMAETIARTHHEKWNGSGYPRGLKEDEIPSEGQIAAICDVFDALTSARPYKDAWPVETAMTYIEKQSGKQFNPEIVIAFKKVFPRILKVQKKFEEK